LLCYVSGCPVGGAIYGYRKNSLGKWEHDPPAAEVVAMIYSMALEGKTTAQIRDKLFADRHLAPREHKYLSMGIDIISKDNGITCCFIIEDYRV